MSIFPPAIGVVFKESIGAEMVSTCPVCGGSELEEFLRRESVPVHQNLLFDSEADARQLASGILSMVICHTCNFVFNPEFDPSLLSYGTQYDNSQQFSPAFESHLNSLVDRLVNDRGVHDCTIVEVGCGKGDFLRRLTANEEHRNVAHGFDPAYVGPDKDGNGRITFHRQFYSEESSRIPADVVISRHVIEHVPDPLQLLGNIHAALTTSPNARVFFETPCVEWILENEVAWDFFYEHCSLFSATSLSRAFEESGFRVLSVDHVFGGQYLWLEAVLADKDELKSGLRSVPVSRTQPVKLAQCYGELEAPRNASWLKDIRGQRQAGKMAIWGAGAKCVTFANLIDPARDLFDYVVDINPNKQGRYLAGTGHPIVGPAELIERETKTVLVLNPNYCSEIRQVLAEAGVSINVVDLMREGAKAA